MHLDTAELPHNCPSLVTLLCSKQPLQHEDTGLLLLGIGAPPLIDADTDTDELTLAGSEETGTEEIEEVLRGATGLELADGGIEDVAGATGAVPIGQKPLSQDSYSVRSQ